jgi:hypothetical protein
MAHCSAKRARRIRQRACKYAAIVLSTRKNEDSLAPLAFSLAVFFESYIAGGSKATAKDFGPKKPVKLKVSR